MVERIADRASRDRWQKITSPGLLSTACHLAQRFILPKAFRELMCGVGGGHKPPGIDRLTSIGAEGQWNALQRTDFPKSPRNLAELATKPLRELSNNDVETIRKWARKNLHLDNAGRILWAVGDARSSDLALRARALELEHGKPKVEADRDLRSRMRDLPYLALNVPNAAIELMNHSLGSRASYIDEETLRLLAHIALALSAVPKSKLDVPWSQTILRYVLNEALRQDLTITENEHGGAATIISEFSGEHDRLVRMGVRLFVVPETHADAFFDEMEETSPTWDVKSEHRRLTTSSRHKDQDVAYPQNDVGLANKRM